MILIQNVIDFDYQKHLKLLSKVEQQRVLKFVKLNDRKLAVSGILIIRMLTCCNAEIIRTKKPFIEGIPGNFNISHHKNYAIGIYSKLSLVGIDVTIIDPEIIHSLDAFRNTFTTHEWDYINQAVPIRFATIWALKEAYLKSTGEGLSIDLKRIEFTVSTSKPTVSQSRAYLDKEYSIMLKVDGLIVKDYYFEVWMIDEEHLVAVAIKDLKKSEFTVPVHEKALEVNETRISEIETMSM